MTYIFAFILTSFLACGDKSTDTSDISDSTYVCPTIEEDSCMTEELYQECLEVVESCDSGNIVTADSCPYGGFDCME